jgi:hypothetical protein
MNRLATQQRAQGFWHAVRRPGVQERTHLSVMVAIPAAAVCLVVAINGNCAPLTADMHSLSVLAGEVGKTLLEELREVIFLLSL